MPLPYSDARSRLPSTQPIVEFVRVSLPRRVAYVCVWHYVLKLCFGVLSAIKEDVMSRSATAKTQQPQSSRQMASSFFVLLSGWKTKDMGDLGRLSIVIDRSMDRIETCFACRSMHVSITLSLD